MKSGFTLIELLAVMVIIVILAAIGIPIYMNAVMKAEDTEVEILLDLLATPLEEYRVINGKYPDDEVQGVTPTLKGWSTEIPFNSILDYDHWSIGGGRCVVLVTHFGRDKIRSSPVHVRAGNPGSIQIIGDDFVKTVSEYECDRPVGAVR